VLEQTVSRELAEALRVDGRFGEAVTMMGRAAASLTALGRDDTQNAGTLLNNWGLTLNQLGRADEAERVLRRALDISRDDRGEDVVSPMLLVNYARVLRDLHRLDEAADYAERAYEKARAAGDDVVINQSLLLRGATYRERGDLARARDMFDLVEPRLRAQLPAGHIAFASLASERGVLAQAQGHLAPALALTERALALANASVASGGQGSEYIPVILTRKAGIELQLGRTGAAVADADRAVTLLAPTVEPGSRSLTFARATEMRDRAHRAMASPSNAPH
jgi:tetratricopeptide (TPR) repeat protein